MIRCLRLNIDIDRTKFLLSGQCPKQWEYGTSFCFYYQIRMIRQKRRRRVYRIPTAFQKWCAHIREGNALTCQHCGAELRPEHCDKTLNKHFRNKCQSDRNDVSPCVPNGPEATSNWALPAGGFALPNTGQNHFAGDDYLREYLNHIELNPGYDDDGPVRRQLLTAQIHVSV